MTRKEINELKSVCEKLLKGTSAIAEIAKRVGCTKMTVLNVFKCDHLTKTGKKVMAVVGGYIKQELVRQRKENAALEKSLNELKSIL